MALAHCDGMDGAVVKAAQKALAEGDVNLVLIWVQPDDEAAIKTAFQKTLAVRKLGPEARELADMYLFERMLCRPDGLMLKRMPPSCTRQRESMKASTAMWTTSIIKRRPKMKPTDILMSEHRVIEQVLDCLEKILAQCTSENKLDTASAKQAIEFFRGFADHCHHGKEEAQLFPVMETSGFSGDCSPVVVMLREHELGRLYIQGMDATIGPAAAGDAETPRVVDDAGRAAAGGQSPCGQPCSPTRRTNRQGVRRVFKSRSPWRRTARRNWVSSSPTGITRIPPSASWSVKARGISGAPAVTRIRS